MKDQKYCIELQANNTDKKKGTKKYVFSVQTETERKKWVAALMRASTHKSPVSMEEGTNPISKAVAESASSSKSTCEVEMTSRDDSIVSISIGPDEKQGYLMKKSPSAFQGYQKRYFHLRSPGELAYFGSVRIYLFLVYAVFLCLYFCTRQ